MDLDGLRHLARTRGQWGGLDDLAGIEAPTPAADQPPTVSRRDLFRLMGASLTLMTVAGCAPSGEALPYVQVPEGTVPGVPDHYATAWVLNGWAQPVVATTHVGRPTKLEGNPNHPASRGATDLFTQASILGLYDPDRSQVLRHRGGDAGWSDLLMELVARMGTWRAAQGKGLAFLTGDVTSPTLIARMAEIGRRYPQCGWYRCDSAERGNRDAGLALAFGRPLSLHYRLDRAKAIVSLDDDLLGFGPRQTMHTLHWGQARRAGRANGRPAILAAESVPGLLGARADHRHAVAAGRMPALMAGLSSRFGLGGSAPPLAPDETAFCDRAAALLKSHPGEGLVAVGNHLAPELHAAAAAVNHAIGAAGRTVIYTQPLSLPLVEPATSLAALARAMAAGEVEALVIIDANPVYTAPADIPFADLLPKVKFTLHAAPFVDETGDLCQWHVPLLHPFEDWGDARAPDGTVALMQPLVQPLTGGRSVHTLLGVLTGKLDAKPREALRTTHASLDDDSWTEALRIGVLADSAPAPVDPGKPKSVTIPPPAAAGAVEAVIRPDPRVWDGSLANIAWLQEVGDPLGKITWENVATVSPALAESLGARNGDVVEITAGGATIRAPLWVLPGQAPVTIGLTQGYGRTRAGRVGNGRGYDANRLRTTSAPWTIGGVHLARTGETADLARLQVTQTAESRHPVLTVAGPEEKVAVEPGPQTALWPPWPKARHAWAMSIDLDLCTGCNACVVACQAENNVPVVGKDQVARGRAMHWLRIDRYYQGGLDHPDATLFQPVPCMHCEQAPCEIGCPVYAAVHSSEGINEQVYNRCIGTRTCESYCPYKVRRFNFYTYAAVRKPLDAQYNPDVTVRARGVMEKCTYCIQRIEAKRIQAGIENRDLKGDEVVPACAQVCPSRVITFGDLNDPDNPAARLRGDPRTYSLLGELNTRPRTTYLARIRQRQET